MTRPFLGLVAWTWAGILVGIGDLQRAAAVEDPRTARSFLTALRERGLYDLALDFIDRLRDDPETPADLKAILDYEQGRTLIDEAARLGDLARRRELLEQARARLDHFVQEQPEHPQAIDALVQIARMLVERGHLSLLLRDETQDPAQKDAREREARQAFTQAHEAYDRSVTRLEAAYKKFAGFLPPNDPRFEERGRVYSALLDAMLQRGIAIYELAQSYPPGSPERTRLLVDAEKQFDQLYKDYRTQLAGLTAQMWQAKCFEEQGKLGEAIGIYKSLLDQPDPRLRPLQRFVGYFHIGALSKRKEHARAADEAVRWLATYNRREERNSQEGLGVLLELAKNLDAQLGEVTDPAQRQPAIRRIIDASSQVARYTSPFKKEAIELLKKYRPALAARAEEIARLSYSEAMSQADDAISANDWTRAITLLTAAIRKADPLRDIDKANAARYNLAFCYYMNKQFYEANVLAEHLARRYPQGGLSPKAAEIGMQALADSYNTFNQFDRTSDLERLIDLARYTAETWADREQGDDARINLGMIYQGRGQYEDAIAQFSAVRERSPKRLEAQNRMGAAHWLWSRQLDRQGQREEADRQASRAIELLRQTLNQRQAAGAPLTDPAVVGNVADLAVALTETGKTAEALRLLAPVVQAQITTSGAAYTNLLEASLLAHVNAGQLEQAIDTMKALEASGDSAGRIQLYIKLGRLLDQELGKLREGNDVAALERMKQTYRSFLVALAGSKTGQTVESLQWVGESLLSVDAFSDAEAVLRRALALVGESTDASGQAGPTDRLLRIRLKLAAALRSQGPRNSDKLEEANALVEQLLLDYPRFIEPLFEKGMLLEARAEAGQGTWSEAYRHWVELARKLGRSRSNWYYDSWYHAAWALYRQKEVAKARQTLAGIMRLNADLGTPEMKRKYEQFLARMKE